MHNYNNRHIKNLWTGLFLLIILTTIINNAINRHTHIKNNGEIIQHAHPYADNDDSLPCHDHNEFEYSLFSDIDLHQNITITLPVVRFIITWDYNIDVNNNVFLIQNCISLLRAPPSFIA